MNNELGKAVIDKLSGREIMMTARIATGGTLLLVIIVCGLGYNLKIGPIALTKHSKGSINKNGGEVNTCSRV